MDRVKLSRIDEELESSEVAALCFLCRDVVQKKRLEGVRDAKDLFLRLEEKDLLNNYSFLSQLLDTIRRADLLSLLETDSRRPEETDASPVLSAYRVMLYKIYEDMTDENFDRMKFLLSDKLGKRNIETCDTALDLFAEMEKAGFLSKTKLTELLIVLQEFDQQLASNVQRYIEGQTQQEQTRIPPPVSIDNQSHQIIRPTPVLLPVSETQPSYEESISPDAEPLSVFSDLTDEIEYYPLNHIPRGLCVIINNEDFSGTQLSNRRGAHQDENALRSVFTHLGFEMVVYNNLTAENIRFEIQKLGERNFLDHDALVVCVLSHGEKGCVFGTDEQQVYLKELTQPFTSGRVPTLAGKPKLFFIQACQGSGYQRGSLPCPPRPKQKEEGNRDILEEDAGHVPVETIPHDADFLLGMATVPEYKSFRNTTTGSIYIQELCRQLERSAKSSTNDDILTVLTRVNREVGRGEYLKHKQMPEPKYTLTKKLVLKIV